MSTALALIPGEFGRGCGNSVDAPPDAVLYYYVKFAMKMITAANTGTYYAYYFAFTWGASRTGRAEVCIPD